MDRNANRMQKGHGNKKTRKTILRYFILPVTVISGLAALYILLTKAYVQFQDYRETEKIRKQTEITSPRGIESIEMVTVGGVEQCISIRAWEKSHPILLFLHGGPGADGLLLSRYFDSELEKNFVVVRWSQRGAGRSYRRGIPSATMNIEQFISDAIEVAEMLIKRFEKEKIYLVGHSWGSALGAIAAARHPELFYAFVGVAQFVNGVENEKITYQFTLGKAEELSNQQALRELEQIGPPPWDDLENLFVQRKWLKEFRGVNYQKLPNLWRMSGLSPDAVRDDPKRYRRGVIFSLEHMYTKEFVNVNLFEQAPRIDLPVYFFLGRYDFNTPIEISIRYYEQLDAPKGKQIVWFENCAHMIPFEAPEKYARILIKKVLAETYLN